ncbi:hypothetical protein [Amycolatopsis sp. cmx-11-32]|uniref:hypothetical protein n=1 Tax=Amycolatopsis sp. cmx-11-32 TaxID=2785796 RepID=UPI0039E551F8
MISEPSSGKQAESCVEVGTINVPISTQPQADLRPTARAGPARPARTGEEDAILDLLAEAAAWLAGRGIRQWPRRFPREQILRQIERGEVLLIIRRGEPIATCVIVEAEPDL